VLKRMMGDGTAGLQNLLQWGHTCHPLSHQTHILLSYFFANERQIRLGLKLVCKHTMLCNWAQPITHASITHPRNNACFFSSTKRVSLQPPPPRTLATWKATSNVM
jgi:hypothetical protein